MDTIDIIVISGFVGLLVTARILSLFLDKRDRESRWDYQSTVYQMNKKVKRTNIC